VYSIQNDKVNQETALIDLCLLYLLDFLTFTIHFMIVIIELYCVDLEKRESMLVDAVQDDK